MYNLKYYQRLSRLFRLIPILSFVFFEVDGLWILVLICGQKVSRTFGRFYLYISSSQRTFAICSRDNCHPWPFGKHENFHSQSKSWSRETPSHPAPPPKKKKKNDGQLFHWMPKRYIKKHHLQKKSTTKTMGWCGIPTYDEGIPTSHERIPTSHEGIPTSHGRNQDSTMWDFHFTFLRLNLLWHAPVWRSVDPSFLDDSPGGVNALTRKGTAVPRLFFVPLDSECRIIRDFGERISVRFFLKKGIFEVEL